MEIELDFYRFRNKKPIHPLFMSFAHLKGQNTLNDLIWKFWPYQQY